MYSRADDALKTVDERKSGSKRSAEVRSQRVKMRRDLLRVKIWPRIEADFGHLSPKHKLKKVLDLLKKENGSYFARDIPEDGPTTSQLQTVRGDLDAITKRGWRRKKTD